MMIVLFGLTAFIVGVGIGIFLAKIDFGGGFEWDDDLYEETGDGYTNEQYNEASFCEFDYYEWSIDEIDEEDEDELENWKTYPFETYASR